jgi:hypothetical protein
LQNPQWIAFDNSWGEEIYLPDVDEGTGHVLIHYLYTGTYQTLDDIQFSPAEMARVEFKRAVLAYSAAKKYMLHGLQRLAGQQISYSLKRSIKTSRGSQVTPPRSTDTWAAK